VNKAQAVQAFAGKRPQLAADVFVAPNASVVGDVKLGSGASVWYGAIIRGERCLHQSPPITRALQQPPPASTAARWCCSLRAAQRHCVFPSGSPAGQAT
jgi:hypothetical protein